MSLSNKTTMKRLKERDSYSYYRRVRKILETTLNSGNIITEINTQAISLLRYSAALLDWTEAELEQMYRKTRKLMTMHWPLNPKSDVARTSLSRKERGRGLISVEETVNLAILGLERYVLTSEEGLLIAARRVDGDYEQHLGMIESVEEFEERRRNERSNMLKQRKLYGQFFNKIEVAGEENGYG